MGVRNLRGESLQRAIAVLSSVAFLVQGYNQAMMNGFTTLPSFVRLIPQVDTTHTTGTQKSHNADIQGQSDRSVDDPDVAKEIAVIRVAMSRATDHGKKYSTNPFALNQNRHLYRSLLAITTTMLLQLTGIGVIAFYSVSIFEETLGYSGASVRGLSASLQVTLALGGLTNVFCVDRIGRAADAILLVVHGRLPGRRRRLDI